MATLVNLDGELLPPDRATISVFDRGFLYGDSVYEVIRTYGGRPFELDRHLRRLESSAERIGMALPWTRERLAHELDRTLAAAQLTDAYVRIVVTRGAGPIGLDPSLAVDPRVIVIAQDVSPPPPAAYRDGVRLQVVGVRRNWKEALDPAAKTGNYLNSILAAREARAAGAFEAILLDARGRVTEGSSSNLFVVRVGALATPPLAVGILEGVTRAVVLELAQEAGLPAREADLGPEDLAAADEVFLTSSIREIVPVVRIGLADREVTIGAGTPGPVTARLRAAFDRRTRPA